MAGKDTSPSYKACSEAVYLLARSAILCCEGNLIDLRCKAVSWCQEGLRQCNAHCPEIRLFAGRVPDDATMGSMWEHRIEI